MAGSRRFLLLGFIGVVLILSFWYRPPPSIRAYAPSWALPKGTHKDETSKDETYPYAAEQSSSDSGTKGEGSFNLVSSNVQGSATSTLAVHSESAAAISEAFTHPVTVGTATITSAPIVHTASAPAWTPAAPVDPFTAAGDADLYEYLHESQSEGPASKETGVVDEFAYLSETHVAHVSTTTAPAQTTVTVPSGFVTSILSAHLSSNAGIHHEDSALAYSQAATATLHAASVTDIDMGVTTFPDPDEKEFGGGHWFFQNEITDYALPKFDVQHLKTYTPHNYKGPGHETYATFLSTRNTSLRDPYFLGTLQQAHRLLWDPHVKSKSHPFTVFVAPHIPRPQRDYLAASGAYVKEIELIEFHPPYPSEAAPRWRDMFTKLNLWAQTEFSRILYLDTDAFVINPIDELWDISKTQRCVEDKLPPEDLKRLDEICDYTFTAVGDGDGINAGMMIFNPNDAMHAHLIRESQDPHKFDPMYMEQAFLSVVYERPGPFPMQEVERKWNAIFTKPEDEGNINVVHEKLWAMWFTPDHFAANYFRTNWDQMLKLYESSEWVKMRTAGGPMST